MQPNVSAETEKAEVEALTPPAPSSSQLKHAQMTDRSTSQLETVKSEIAALTEGEMRALLDDLKEHMAAQKMPARLRLRVEAGELDTPMIHGILARLHWKKTRGTNWSDES